MLQILDIIAPVFLLVAAGFAAAKGGVVNADGGRALGAVVLWAAFPALIIRAFIDRGVAFILDWRLLLAYGLAAVAVFFAMHVYFRARGRTHARAGIASLGSAGSNSGFVGLPLITIALGEDIAAVILANALIIENAVIIPLGLGMAAREGAVGRGVAIRQALVTGFAKNPMVISVAVGAVLSLSGIGLPGPTDRAAELLAGASTAMALVSVGVALALAPKGRARRDMGPTLAAKLLVLPALTLGGAMLLRDWAGLPEVRAAGVALTAACPIMATFPLLGRRADEEPWCAKVMVASMAVSVGTLSGWLWLLTV